MRVKTTDQVIWGLGNRGALLYKVRLILGIVHVGGDRVQG